MNKLKRKCFRCKSEYQKEYKIVYNHGTCEYCYNYIHSNQKIVKVKKGINIK